MRSDFSLNTTYYMVVNVSVQYYGGFLPDILLLNLLYVTTSGNPLNTMKSICPYSHIVKKNLNAAQLPEKSKDLGVGGNIGLRKI